MKLRNKTVELETQGTRGLPSVWGWGISHTSIKPPPPPSHGFFLGRRFLGHCFLGHRFLGRCFLGRRFLGRCFLDTTNFVIHTSETMNTHKNFHIKFVESGDPPFLFFLFIMTT